MGYRIENVVIFPEKKEILINRGGRHRVIGFTNEGGVMVRLKGFENYYLCVRTGEIYSKRSGNRYEPLKKVLEGGAVYYQLYINGQRLRTPLFQILRENLKEIEEYFSKNSGFLKLVGTSLS